MIAVIDYKAGNVRSVLNALRKTWCGGHLTSEAEVIQKADKVIFPGRGCAGQGMASLRLGRGGVKNCEQPFLGICLGMQLLFDYSEEDESQMRV